jgi:4a-hydroxytetrahydrobiopterin dehydratase
MATSQQLVSKHCVACTKETPAITGKALEDMRKQLGGNWKVVDGSRLEKSYTFKDFAGALAFTNRVGAIAESEGHHPEITLGWGKVTIALWTHIINGLSEADFIIAAKADQAY